ncbi:MAG: hypothetical protein JWN62_4216 [Acidimicrobiales bacterium]|nr:hypothetical protein [Acidimicrobiales bacterium]
MTGSGASGGSGARFSWVKVALALAARPGLWPTARRQMRRTAAPGWFKRPPFLPLPSGEYLRFRLVTQYGDALHRPEPADVINYLSWCRAWDSNP